MRVGLSTSFFVTQAQRDLLQAQVALLQAALDYQSSVVNFEALRFAGPAGVERRSVSADPTSSSCRRPRHVAFPAGGQD